MPTYLEHGAISPDSDDVEFAHIVALDDKALRHTIAAHDEAIASIESQLDMLEVRPGWRDEEWAVKARTKLRFLRVRRGQCADELGSRTGRDSDWNRVFVSVARDELSGRQFADLAALADEELHDDH